MPRIAYFDCLSGISGDMTLGALIDLGVEPSAIQSAVRSMGLPELSITTKEVKKAGFRAVYVTIDHPPEHAHRHLHHITEMIQRADQIDPAAKELAGRIFHEVAVAEAKVHGSTIEKVHFHEVGAIDSIADIVGTAVAMTQLGIVSTVSSPIPTGTGTIRIAHGRVSIPAPATAEILRGVPIAACDIQAELTTPTGAAIIKATATGFGSVPAMTIDAVGYGAGTMDLDGQANVLRVLLGDVSDDQISASTNIKSDRVVVLETNLDDATPEQVADCASRLMEAGALDVFQTAATMKKGRAGVVLSVIAAAAKVGLMEQLIFQHSTSIGIRRQTMDRHKLARQSETVTTEFGDVRVKVVTLPNGEKRMSVEDDDARCLASEKNTTADAVRNAALSVWR
ncbi:MAG: nickel pincer cofactor biosynthesis protein LarC [Pirellulaceae bacterium]